MSTSDEPIYLRDPGELLNLQKRINHPRVSTSSDHSGTHTLDISPQREVITDQILYLLAIYHPNPFSLTRRNTGHLERPPLHFPRGTEAWHNLDGALREDNGSTR